MNISIKVNSQTIPALETQEAEATRKAISDVITTQNIDAKTTKLALEFLGGKGYAEAFGKSGKPTDVIEVYENEVLTGRGKRANVAQRMLDSLSQDARMVEVFTVKGAKKADVSQKVVTF